ncbi:Neur-chan-LBD domain-containing protein [Aphelenchoides fujianensis]|nr:Neur-chan-LBD domain-containing protein [Aphelenchoides fujianensis]
MRSKWTVLLVFLVADCVLRRRADGREFAGPAGSSAPTGAASIPGVRAPVFRISHTADGVYAAKLPPYESEEDEYYEETPEVETAETAAYYDEPPTEPAPTIDSELADAVTDTEIINKLLNRGYDWRVRPPGTNLSIPAYRRSTTVQLTFRESWVDGRLAYGLPNDGKPEFLILSSGQQIWMPDSFFQNEKSAQKHMPSARDRAGVSRVI